MARTTTLSSKQLTQKLKSLEHFEPTPKKSKLNAEFTFPTYVAALVFIARVTVFAEVLQHYPDIHFTHKKVKVSLTTHDVKGLTQKDVDLAKRIESISVSVGRG